MSNAINGFKPLNIGELAAFDVELAVSADRIDKLAGKGNSNGILEFSEFTMLTTAERGRYIEAIGKISSSAPAKQAKPAKQEPSLVERAGKAIGDADWLTVSATGSAAAEAAEQLGGKKLGDAVRGIAETISTWKFWNG